MSYSEYYHYRQAWIPLRWLPQESVFEDDFSTKSDVWAFGVLMWEVFSLGELPYTKMADDEVLEGQWWRQRSMDLENDFDAGVTFVWTLARLCGYVIFF